MLVWLQGDMQRYLTHDIMVAAWGNFHDQEHAIQYDFISAIADVRSRSFNDAKISPLLRKLFLRWHELDKTPFTFHSSKNDFLEELTEWECTLGNTSYKMRSVMVHGISDKRAMHDCLYIAFRSKSCFTEAECGVMAALTPCIDTALRQVDLLPPQTSTQKQLSRTNSTAPLCLLSDRELEILHLITVGKTNPEISSILNISEFTVKNHMKRIFKKINVTNRAQAVGLISKKFD